MNTKGSYTPITDAVIEMVITNNEMVTYTVMKNYVMGNWELTFVSLTSCCGIIFKSQILIAEMRYNVKNNILNKNETKIMRKNPQNKIDKYLLNATR